jgi:hypothetical protein
LGSILSRVLGLGLSGCNAISLQAPQADTLCSGGSLAAIYNDEYTSSIMLAQVVVLCNQDLDFPSPAADTIQTPAIGAPIHPKRPPIESSSWRTESIAHLFAMHWRFSAVISWSGSNFNRRGLEALPVPLHRLKIEVTWGNGSALGGCIAIRCNVQSDFC